MRIVIILTLSAVSALAQQANSCGAELKAAERVRVLLQEKAVPPEQASAAQEAYARCQKQQTEGAAVKSQLAATQAQLDELRKRFSDSYPDVKALQAKLDELRAREIKLSMERPPEALKPLKLPGGGLQTGLPDRWWKNRATAQSLGLTAEQQKKMDDVFQQYRLKLIDLNAALEKEEVTLEPLVASEPLDESKVTAEIDRVAQARAELEKANGRMLLGIRKQLTPEQWNKLSQ
ncbi:MAG TPA: periplasmic heavy metal sensor [Bryobacteraceae bacterium]|jgi:Spy/CpxP family protein refolding chaperone